jgi:multidrug efflux pump subunit AcrA (membrane-fusion protein)
MTDTCRFTSAFLLLCTLVASGAALVYWTSADEPIPEARWLSVIASPLEHRIGLTGRIVPGSSVTMTAPFDGYVAEKHFTDDQRVSPGQLLLSLDPALLHMQIRDALAERLKAESAVQAFEDWPNGEAMARARRALSTSQMALADTQRKLTETRELLEQGIVPRMEADSQVRQLQIQTLDVRAAQAELKQVSKRGQGEHRQIADMQLANTRARHETLLALEQRGQIKAPFAGIIVPLPEGPSGNADKPVEPGVRVTQGQPLFGLASFERLSVKAKVDESDINQLREGMPVEISGDGFDHVLQGTVRAVGAQAIASGMHVDSASYHVTVALPPLENVSQKNLRLGMTARLSVLTYQNPNAVVLPAGVIEEASGKHFVIYRADQHARETRREVTLGRATVDGVEVFGMDAGFVRREVSMN